MSDRATLSFYEAEAPRYTLSSAKGPSRHLVAFLDRLPAGGRVLELGCGGGRDAMHMEARRFALDATDGTPAMVCKASERLKSGARLMVFDDLNAIAAYDGVWANASLLHVPLGNLPSVLTRICHALRPGGWHWACYKLGEGELRDRFGRLYNNPDGPQLCALYEAAGDWRLELFTRFDGVGYDGEPVRWGAVLMNRAP